jgi:D-alanyl-D-alanine-carboxypeptidase/D-alanyl-D-alanine-endopeptidase
MKTKIICSVLFITLFLFGCEKELVNQSIEQEIERVAQKYIIYGRTPGIIIGTIKNGETKIYSNGVANLETGALIDELTIFEIGSITKTFTGLLCAQFALEGKFTLQDTVNNYFQQGFQLPSKNNIPIRWVHLLNHTSGLENQSDDLDSNEPFDYSESQMSAYLSRTGLLSVPGEKHLYSNAGMGLAGFALTKIADSTYSSLLESRVFSKLNMKYSFCNNEEKPENNTAQGYYGNSLYDYLKMTDVFAGAGAIKSNMHDMLIYLTNYLNPQTSVLEDAINMTLTPTFQIEEKRSIGLGWFVVSNDNNQLVAAHNGGTKGFASFIGFNINKKTGVVVLTNSYCVGGEQALVGVEIMKLLDDEN